MTTHLSRRTFNVLFGSALGASMFALVAPGRTAAATSEITVLNWKGYGTDEHWAALRAYGPSAIHRLTFNGVGQMSLWS